MPEHSRTHSGELGRARHDRDIAVGSPCPPLPLAEQALQQVRGADALAVWLGKAQRGQDFLRVSGSRG